MISRNYELLTIDISKYHTLAEK